MINLLNLLMAVVVVVGVLLNTRRKWQGFLFGLASSVWWGGYNIWMGEYVQAGLFGGLCILSLYGIFQWQRDFRHLEKKHKQEIINATAINKAQWRQLLEENRGMRAFIQGLPYHKKAKKRLRINIPTTTKQKG